VRLIAVGAVVGLAGSLAVARLLDGFMAGVTAAVPGMYLGIVAALSGVAATAAALPAWRAARLEPIAALRSD